MERRAWIRGLGLTAAGLMIPARLLPDEPDPKPLAIAHDYGVVVQEGHIVSMRDCQFRATEIAILLMPGAYANIDHCHFDMRDSGGIAIKAMAESEARFQTSNFVLPSIPVVPWPTR